MTLKAEEWVEQVNTCAYIAHGWTKDGKAFPLKIWPSKREAIAQVVEFCEAHGEPPIAATDRKGAR